MAQYNSPPFQGGVRGGYLFSGLLGFYFMDAAFHQHDEKLIVGLVSEQLRYSDTFFQARIGVGNLLRLYNLIEEKTARPCENGKTYLNKKY